MEAPVIWTLLLACAHQAPLSVAPAGDPLLAAYALALTDAERPLPSEVVDDLLVLTPGTPGLTWDDQGRLLVTTWTRSSYYSDPKYQPGYSFPLYGETWFTAGAEVHGACAGMAEPALSTRVEQLLGLPPNGGRDAFLRVWIDPATLFRPCAEPSIEAPSCPIGSPMQATDEGGVSWSCGLTEATLHQRWLCDTWVNRYGASAIEQRYPWTALGYTYDWAKPEHPVGATEIVAPAGTAVILAAVVPNEQFCK